MEELVVFILGMIAEALGLKKKKAAPPPEPLSPARRAVPSPSLRQNGEGNRAGFPMPSPRRPDAGEPLVSPDATTVGFAARERSLEASEPKTSGVTPSLDTPPSSTPPLFAGAADFVRAFALQEALGPPLCRRHRPLR